jgi:hypothetical protein
MTRIIRTCQHCQRPITYSATRREWRHGDSVEAFRAAGQQPCRTPEPRATKAGA